MISLFIFRSNARGMQYGIGTYLNELTQALLKYSDLEIFLVSYKTSGNREFSIQETSDRLLEIRIPGPLFNINQNNYFEKKYAASLINILSDTISKKEHVLFQFNYIDDLPIILRLKQYFSFPVISVVHFAQWQQIFEGNRKKVAGLNLDQPTNNIEFTLSQEREIYRQSDHIVSVTSYMKEFLVNEFGIQPDKISVIKNGLENESPHPISEAEKIKIRKSLGFGENDIIVLFSGRIDSCKGIIFLIKAFEQACNSNSDLRLVMLGQGNIQDCQEKLHSFYGRVTYTGFLPKDAVTLFYKIADIGIAPSVYDHCPYTVLEMMAYRIPMIMSRINGLDELLSDSQCLFVDPVISLDGDISFNPEELSDAILTLADNKKLRIRLCEDSYRSFERSFTASGMAYEMHRLYYSLTNHKKITFEYEESKSG